MSDVPETPEAPGLGLAELRRVEDDLAGVQAALARLDDGSYGRCAACGGEIGDEELAADPTAVLCGACAPGPG